MKRLGSCCIDCGSKPVETIADEVRPFFSMRVVTFACGAVMKKSFSRNGNVARVSHTGCPINNK